MKRADLHVHSHYSTHPSEWFLQRIGTQESYSQPEMIYKVARERGMDFVTVTDHNCMRASLELQARYPESVLTGVEVTTYFPADGCKIHVLVWGLDRDQFREIDRLREDIFELRLFIRQEQLAHAVAHATFSINHTLTLEHFEKLLLLFDYFEGINGSRGRRGNDILINALHELTPMVFEELYARHGIEPFSDEPWRKGVTAGSDDHGGLFIAKTWTCFPDSVTTPQGCLEALRRRETNPAGRHNDYRGFALSLYKIAYDFSRTRSSALGASFMRTLNSVLFENRNPDLRTRIALKKMKHSGGKDRKNVGQLLAQMVAEFEQIQDLPIDEKLDRIYESIGLLMDELLRQNALSISRSLLEGDLAGVVKHISGLLPAAFISVPFFTTIKVLHDARDVLDAIDSRYGAQGINSRKRYLWFTDTLTDLNGVSETIQRLGWLSHERKLNLSIITCMGENQGVELPPNVIALPAVMSYTPSFFKTFTLNIPSVLATLKAVSEAEPDSIFVSTPGPVGLMGILLARLLNVPCTGIYHTDFGAYASKVAGDDALAKLVEDLLRVVYSQCTTIRVPTMEYMNILEARGYDRTKMKRFRRGIEHAVFAPISCARETMEQLYGVRPGVHLLYVGRVSKEKNIDQLLRIYKRLCADYENLNLLICGDGPDLSEITQDASGYPGVHFLGRLPRKTLPLLYSAADCLVFPSTTDTFGMVVLEAQSCGLPAIVSDKGGPQEIVAHKSTGIVVESDNDDAWHAALSEMLSTVRHFPEQHLEMRYRARDMVTRTYSWDLVFADLFGEKTVLKGKSAGSAQCRNPDLVAGRAP